MQTRLEVLAALVAKKITEQEADALLAKLDRVARQKSLYCKVSIKGAISVYGLQRMPVTLYVEQWQRLLSFADDLNLFARDNDSLLSRKGDGENKVVAQVEAAVAAQAEPAKGKAKTNGKAATAAAVAG